MLVLALLPFAFAAIWFLEDIRAEVRAIRRALQTDDEKGGG